MKCAACTKRKKLHEAQQENACRSLVRSTKHSPLKAVNYLSIKPGAEGTCLILANNLARRAKLRRRRRHRRTQMHHYAKKTADVSGLLREAQKRREAPYAGRILDKSREATLSFGTNVPKDVRRKGSFARRAKGGAKRRRRLVCLAPLCQKKTSSVRRLRREAPLAGLPKCPCFHSALRPKGVTLSVSERSERPLVPIGRSMIAHDKI